MQAYGDCAGPFACNQGNAKALAGKGFGIDAGSGCKVCRWVQININFEWADSVGIRTVNGHDGILCRPATLHGGEACQVGLGHCFGQGAKRVRTLRKCFRQGQDQDECLGQGQVQDRVKIIWVKIQSRTVLW